MPDEKSYYGRGSKGWGFLGKLVRKYNNELPAHLQEEIERSEMSEEEAVAYVIDCLKKRRTHELVERFRPRIVN